MCTCESIEGQPSQKRESLPKFGTEHPLRFLQPVYELINADGCFHNH